MMTSVTKFVATKSGISLSFTTVSLVTVTNVMQELTTHILLRVKPTTLTTLQITAQLTVTKVHASLMARLPISRRKKRQTLGTIVSSKIRHVPYRRSYPFV